MVMLGNGYSHSWAVHTQLMSTKEGGGHSISYVSTLIYERMLDCTHASSVCAHKLEDARTVPEHIGYNLTRLST